MFDKKIKISGEYYRELIEIFPELLDPNELVRSFVVGSKYVIGDRLHTTIEGIQREDDVKPIVSYEKLNDQYTLGVESGETITPVVQCDYKIRVAKAIRKEQTGFDNK